MLLMIVNRNPGMPGRVVVEMQDGWKSFGVTKRVNTKESTLPSSFHVGLEPSDGRLYRFERRAG